MFRGCSLLFRGCSGVLWDVPGVFRGPQEPIRGLLSGVVLGCSGLFRAVLGVFRGCSGVFRGCSGVFRVLQTPISENQKPPSSFLSLIAPPLYFANPTKMHSADNLLLTDSEKLIDNFKWCFFFISHNDFSFSTGDVHFNHQSFSRLMVFHSQWVIYNHA